MIVDFIMPAEAIVWMDNTIDVDGRIVLAGTPSLYSAGFKEATNSVLLRMNANLENSVVLGGDTVADVGYIGPTSTGGGSALHLIAHGTSPVFEALKANKAKFH